MSDGHFNKIQFLLILQMAAQNLFATSDRRMVWSI